MNPEIKTRWVEALRSGKYIQGSNALRYLTADKEEHWCCLGVLCDLVAPKAWVAPVGLPRRFSHLDGADGMPSAGVRDAADLPPRQAQDLARLNDEGYSFEDIAKEIEKL